MEIILKQDVLNLGYTNEIVTVKNGYGNNYLIPQGLGILATVTNRKILAENVKQKAFKEQKVKMQAEGIAKKLDGITVKIGAKASGTGKIFGSVNALQIAEALKEQFKIEIDRKRIAVDGESIKDLGTYQAKVNLHKEVKVQIAIEVFAE
jgi:large subunit ribosomal protein L9